MLRSFGSSIKLSTGKVQEIAVLTVTVIFKNKMTPRRCARTRVSSTMVLVKVSFVSASFSCFLT